MKDRKIFKRLRPIATGEEGNNPQGRQTSDSHASQLARKNWEQWSSFLVVLVTLKTKTLTSVQEVASVTLCDSLLYCLESVLVDYENILLLNVQSMLFQIEHTLIPFHLFSISLYAGVVHRV